MRTFCRWRSDRVKTLTLGLNSRYSELELGAGTDVLTRLITNGQEADTVLGRVPTENSSRRPKLVRQVLEQAMVDGIFEVEYRITQDNRILVVV